MSEKILSIPDTVTVGELADILRVPVAKMVGELFKNGIVATVNQRIDFETAEIIIGELGLDVTLERQQLSDSSPVLYSHELSDDARERPPIVAVMGHVDHGKTSLLDAILDTKVASAEAGGITQHISAYQTVRNGRKITLLDTPGHEAFSALRQHGATLTDVVIIVVAADDGVKPQTVEAIKFAQNANAKIVVAITKCDKEAADVNRVKAQLASEYNLNPEEWGGDVVMVDVSAKTGHNLDKLLDMVLLVADLEDLRADYDVDPEGLVIESHMETGKGSVVTMLVEHGEVRKGQFIVAGGVYGKIRTLSDYAGRTIDIAGPATPVTITGFKEVPQFGDRFHVSTSEKDARQNAEENRIQVQRAASKTNVTGADLLSMMNQSRDTQDFPVVLRADVQGSLTSVVDSLKLIDSADISVKIVSSGVSSITENDVRLAAGSKAIVYGFNVSLPPSVKRLAARDKVSVRVFRVIYELLDDVRTEMESRLSPDVVDTVVGQLKVQGVFRTTKDSIICGGDVLSGKLTSGQLVRIIRDKEVISEAQVTRLQRQQQEAKEVIEGEQCGLELKTSGKIAIETGDLLEFFTRELVKKTIKS